MLHIFLILVSVLLTALGQLMFRQGMATVDRIQPQAGLWQLIGYGLFNGYVLLGFLFFGSGALLWLAVLAKEEVSYAYPISSLGYIVVLAGSYFLFQEHITLPRLLGIALIILGVICIEYSR
ncbi:MAG: EamA family transporter [Deltaproteobacteria bacterium]|nr:EamA family transporter [Deltaproteobacteria bacterium]